MTENSDGALEVRPIAGALGAEIGGVDLASDLAEETVAEIRRAWLEHLVVFFRDQSLGSDEFLAFARRLGEPVEYPFVQGLDGFPGDHRGHEAAARDRELRRHLAQRHRLPRTPADGHHARCP